MCLRLKSSSARRAATSSPSPCRPPTISSKSTCLWESRLNGISRRCTRCPTPSRCMVSRSASGTPIGDRTSVLGSSLRPRTACTRYRVRSQQRRWEQRVVDGQRKCSSPFVMVRQSCSSYPETRLPRNCASTLQQQAFPRRLRGRLNKAFIIPRCLPSRPRRFSTGPRSSPTPRPPSPTAPQSSPAPRLRPRQHLHFPSPWSSHGGTGCSCTRTVLLLSHVRVTRLSGMSRCHW
jgi:hypothetical protein